MWSSEPQTLARVTSRRISPGPGSATSYSRSSVRRGATRTTTVPRISHLLDDADRFSAAAATASLRSRSGWRERSGSREMKPSPGFARREFEAVGESPDQDRARPEEGDDASDAGSRLGGDALLRRGRADSGREPRECRPQRSGGTPGRITLPYPAPTARRPVDDRNPVRPARPRRRGAAGHGGGDDPSPGRAGGSRGESRGARRISQAEYAVRVPDESEMRRAPRLSPRDPP